MSADEFKEMESIIKRVKSRLSPEKLHELECYQNMFMNQVYMSRNPTMSAIAMAQALLTIFNDLFAEFQSTKDAQKKN